MGFKTNFPSRDLVKTSWRKFAKKEPVKEFTLNGEKMRTGGGWETFSTVELSDDFLFRLWKEGRAVDRFNILASASKPSGHGLPEEFAQELMDFAEGRLEPSEERMTQDELRLLFNTRELNLLFPRSRHGKLEKERILNLARRWLGWTMEWEDEIKEGGRHELVWVPPAK